MENKKINKADFLKEITDKTAEKAKTLGFTDEDIDLTKRIVDALAAKFEKNVTVDKVTEIVNDVATELGISKTAVKGVVISTIIDSLVAFCGLPADPAKKEDKPAEGEPKTDDDQGKKPEEPVPAVVTESVGVTEYDTDKVAKDIEKLIVDHVNKYIDNGTLKIKNKERAFTIINDCVKKAKFEVGDTTTIKDFASTLSDILFMVGLFDLSKFIDSNSTTVKKLIAKYEEEAKNPDSKDAE